MRILTSYISIAATYKKNQQFIAYLTVIKVDVYVNDFKKLLKQNLFTVKYKRRNI